MTAPLESGKCRIVSQKLNQKDGMDLEKVRIPEMDRFAQEAYLYRQWIQLLTRIQRLNSKAVFGPAVKNIS